MELVGVQGEPLKISQRGTHTPPPPEHRVSTPPAQAIDLTGDGDLTDVGGEPAEGQAGEGAEHSGGVVGDAFEELMALVRTARPLVLDFAALDDE